MENINPQINEYSQNNSAREPPSDATPTASAATPTDVNTTFVDQSTPPANLTPDHPFLHEGWVSGGGGGGGGGGRNDLRTEKAVETTLNGGISTSGGTQWTLFGRKTQQSKVVYFTQATILYVLIITSLVNITLESKNLNLWSTLLASAIGYLLPSPQLKERTGQGSSVNRQTP